jgi:anti-anti-sigma regulatory factor
MLKIQRDVQGPGVVFTLSGRIDDESLRELKNTIKTEQRGVVLNLKDVSLASREAVAFLVRCQEDGILTENCPAYIREWIAKERERK